MNDFKHISPLTLTPEERARMRASLREYMAMKPLPSASPASPAWSIPMFFSPRFLSGALILALFASSAGVSYAAQGALPGDLLYGIKTNINEPVQGALAVSAQAKSDWAVSVASTRVQEAATLAAEGKLSTSTQAALQQSFDTHAQQAVALMSAQASTSPDTSVANAVSFEAQLSEYQQVLAQVGEAKNVPTETLASAIHDTELQVGSVRAQAQAKVAASAATSVPSQAIAASHLRDIARTQLEASLALARTDDGALASSSAAQVALQLSNASDTISQGDKLLADNAAPEAQGAFQNALSAAQKLKIFLQTSSIIHAKTGLTIGGSEGDHSSRTNTSATVRTFEAIAPTATVPQSAPMTLSATATTSASSTATTTGEETTSDGGSTVIHINVQNNGSSQEGSGDHNYQESNNNLLPLSVPTSAFSH